MKIQNKINLNYIKKFIYILTIIGIIVFVYININEIKYLIRVDYKHLILLIIVTTFTFLINALLFRNNISIFKINLPFIEWFGLTVSNTMYNYLLPARGGIALRAMYLKNEYNLPYSKYLTFISGTYILNLLNAALLASILSLILIFLGILNKYIFFYLSILSFIIIFLAILFLYKFNPDKIPAKNKILKFIKNSAQSIKHFKNNPNKIKKLVILQITFIFALSLRLFFVFYVLNIHTNFFIIVFINSLVVFSMIFSITPGNIGIKEGIIGLSSSLLNISFDKAVMVALIDRFVAVIIVFALGLFFSNKLLSDMDNQNKN